MALNDPLFRSMQKSLPLVKATIKELVESGSDVPKWILTSFNDPSATVVTETHISADLVTAAELLSFGGGGDAKEQALKGIIQHYPRTNVLQ